jgi:3-hydroxyisobutyrate dehydrogenase-like beta-hydroxyacid dehydrogenase
MSSKGFVGLGVMGSAMAGHIFNNYSDLIVYNRTMDKANSWVQVNGGQAVSNAAEVGELCEQVFLCVGNDEDVKEVVSGEEGVLQSMKKGGVIVDHTTISADISKELSELCSAKEIGFIDAPVSGGQAGAESGQLTVMAGGEEKYFDMVKETIACYSKFIKLMGPSGSGQLTKMVNQICIAGLIQSLAEGINFSEEVGLNTNEVIEVISKGAAQSWQMENRWETMLEDHYDHGFAVDHMRKDLELVIKEANKKGINVDLTKIVNSYYKDIQGIGGNRWDTSSLLKRLKEL